MLKKRECEKIEIQSYVKIERRYRQEHNNNDGEHFENDYEDDRQD